MRDATRRDARARKRCAVARGEMKLRPFPRSSLSRAPRCVMGAYVLPTLRAELVLLNFLCDDDSLSFLERAPTPTRARAVGEI